MKRRLSIRALVPLLTVGFIILSLGLAYVTSRALAHERIVELNLGKVRDRLTLVQGIAEYIGLRPLHQLLPQRLDDAAMGEDPSRRRADLASIGEGAAGGRVRGAVEIGVLEHQHRPVAAEFEQHRLAGAALGDTPAGGGAAGEADAVGVGMDDDLVPRLGTFADDEVDHALRQARLLDRPHQLDRRHRGRRRE